MANKTEHRNRKEQTATKTKQMKMQIPNKTKQTNTKEQTKRNMKKGQRTNKTTNGQQIE